VALQAVPDARSGSFFRSGLEKRVPGDLDNWRVAAQPRRGPWTELFPRPARSLPEIEAISLLTGATARPRRRREESGGAGGQRSGWPFSATPNKRNWRKKFCAGAGETIIRALKTADQRENEREQDKSANAAHRAA